MVDEFKNVIRMKLGKNSRAKRPIESFRLDSDVLYHAKNFKKHGYRSMNHFVNQAIRFFMIIRSNPERLLKILKEQYPHLYKKVGRKRFV